MENSKVLVVDDERMVRWVLSEALRDWSFVPIEAADAESALRLFDSEQPELTLLDINLPDGSGLDVLRKIKSRQTSADVVMITANVLVENAVAALRAGACDFIAKPINLDELRQIVNSCLTNSSPRREAPTTQKKSVSAFDHIIGESPKMKEVIAVARKVAESDVSSVLLQGESGTGKDLIARAIHNASDRAEKPFVAINCAAIPANLIESELFGYEKGAFTDAKTRKEGLFEQAQGGTIFLDEIGELDINLQAKLLRVLEAGVFRRVGGLRDMEFHASVIAASNRNLMQASEIGQFRPDLYFRLSVIEIVIPPLRERGDDVLLLADHFIKTLDRRRYNSKPRGLSPETVEAFRRYRWTGNVRELRNAVERALILEENSRITLKFMPPALSRTATASAGQFGLNGHPQFQLPPEGVSLEAVENSLIEQALQRTNGNVTRAAEILNISRDRMRYYLKKKRLEESD
jgi:Response regulator containing CheY-like receiver, AAA-type ATPase, and DNA-binding domains